MTIRDIIPRFRKDRFTIRKRTDDNMEVFQREINRLFDDFFTDFGLAPFGERAVAEPAAFHPKVDIAETDKAVNVTAELPGMDEKDVSVELADDVLTISGERREEHEEKGRKWHRIEQSYGSFHRVIPLPSQIDTEHVKARFRKGVLTVELPKLPGEESKRKKVEIAAE